MKNKILDMWSNWMKSYFGSKNYSSIEEYQKDHQVCPKCLSEEILDCDCDVETWQEMQSCLAQCLDCGWKALNKDLVPNTKFGKLDSSDLDELVKFATKKYYTD